MKIMDCETSFKCIMFDNANEIKDCKFINNPVLPIYNNIYIKTIMSNVTLFYTALKHEKFLNKFNEIAGMDIEVKDDITKLKLFRVNFMVENNNNVGTSIYFTVSGENFSNVKIVLCDNFNLDTNDVFRILEDKEKVSKEDLDAFGVNTYAIKAMLKDDEDDDSYLTFFKKMVFVI